MIFINGNTHPIKAGTLATKIFCKELRNIELEDFHNELTKHFPNEKGEVEAKSLDVLDFYADLIFSWVEAGYRLEKKVNPLTVDHVLEAVGEAVQAGTIDLLLKPLTQDIESPKQKAEVA